MYKLRDIFIGYNDGKKEASRIKDFEQYYFDYKGNVDKIINSDKFLLLGKKGTGKSLLAEYIKKKSFLESNWSCKLSSYKEFNFHELVHLKSNSIKPNEYIAIWEWIILLEIAQQCIDDESINNEYKDNLIEFMKFNFKGLKLNMNKVIEITKKRTINGGILHPFKILSGRGSDTKYTNGTYLDYIEDLRENVLKALRGCINKYTLIFDELDDKFRNEDIYKSNIISLIKISDKLNDLFYNEDLNIKIILLLRTDIFYILNDPDLNKVEQDGAIKLEWGNTIKSNSPLFSMILNKVKKSIPELESRKDIDLFSSFFPQKINNREPNEFILGRTYFRPRDIVTYLNLIIDKYPDTRYFGYRGFLELEKNYSTYFFKEIRNELFGHLSDEKIDLSFLLLKQYKRSEFTYEEIKAYYKAKMSVYKDIDLDETLKYFFDFGVVGNKQFNSKMGKDFYSWAYRENIEIDYDKKFVLHLGLRKELSV
ncbi:MULTISPECIES: P-loop ATPase, Sll1717 family [Bacillus amyloliquefaciens group]|nr:MULTISPECIES: hypothetical protein [Bacillus amyloliquefaciens group]KNX33061.1 hypothetical protein AFK74_18500 [Bacillus amyloliquefaciens]MBN7742409.1 hypothetical protein [Bacillus velezensis]MCR4383948.1 hypothetical protein [Bacillus amyloliquefaciens]MEB3693655.1 hypothetical protein [Bacillus amyloliquefaciens]QLQ42349.1 hypothetical protein HZT45_18680 [Bacillus velezensis]